MRTSLPSSVSVVPLVSLSFLVSSVKILAEADLLHLSSCSVLEYESPMVIEIAQE